MVNDATSAPDDGSDRDYAMLLATLSSSERGRAFLAEYARRNRLAETEMLLTAIARLEAMIAAQQASLARPAPEEPAPTPPAPAEGPATAGMAQTTSWVEAAPAWADTSPEEAPATAGEQPAALAATDDPFAQLMALSEDERLALFT